MLCEKEFPETIVREALSKVVARPVELGHDRGRKRQSPMQPQEIPENKPLIRLEEIDQAERDVHALQTAVAARVQKLLDLLAGRKGISEEDNKDIAKRVRNLAHSTGIQLMSNGEPATIGWSSRVFLTRTPDGAKSLDSGVRFPRLNARPKEGRAAQTRPADSDAPKDANRGR